MKRKLMLLLTCLFVGIGLVTAQNQTVTGSVISEEDGQPVVGASVLVKGTTLGTITDIDGNFTLSNVPSSAKTLQVSFIGMATQEVAIKQNVRITMKSDSELLEEVMVVAYGTAKRSSLTGSATKIDGEKISKKNPSEISNALAGEVAGVQVFNTSGQPGTNASIRIRGIGSANSSNAPLYVVDGIPFGADLSGIDPSDIESTTVLKDASAAALYGTRAANGVILITTKKGVKGKTRVEADLKYGVNTRIIPLYNTITSPEQFIETTWSSIKSCYQYYAGRDEATAIAQANKNLFGYIDSKGAYQKANGIHVGYNIWDVNGVDVNGIDLIDPTTGKVRAGVNRKFTPEKWDDHIFSTGQKVEGNLKISGGSDKTTHFTSLGYLKDEGYYISSDFERITARTSVNHEISSWLRTNFNMSYAYMKTNNPGQTDNMNNGFQFVNYMPPIFPVFERDANGNKIEDTVIGGYRYDYGMSLGSGRPYASGINPAGAVQLDKRKTTTHQFSGNGMAEIRFLKDFKFTTNLGLQYYNSNLANLTNPYYGDAAGLGRITKESSTYRSVTFNQILNWKKQFGDHTVDAFVAHESYEMDLSYMGGQKSKLILPSSFEWSNAVIMGNMDSDTYGYALESYFGQVRYDYMEKYFFDASMRRDGSSRFTKGNKWGTFGHVGAAWMLTKESFMEDLDWLKELKLKASFGVLGNQSFSTSPTAASYYPYNDLYTIGNLMDSPSISFVYKGNKELTWEKSYTFNVGFEFKITDFLEGEFEYYNKSTKDMLYMKQVVPSFGYASFPVNDGELRNQGVEFMLKAAIINTNDVKFNFRVNGGYYKNEMTKMPLDNLKGEPKTVEVRGAYAWAKGHSLYDFYLREYAGVDSETGLALYNSYYNVKSNGTKELISNMESYKANNEIGTLEVETTDDLNKATLKYSGKSAMPKLSGGFGFDLEVKGFEFNSTFTYSLGGYALDYVYATLMSDNSSGKGNWHKDIEKRWQKPGDITDVPRLAMGYDLYTSATSTRFLTKRSYLNLANIRLGYTFPKSWLGKLDIQSLNVFVSGDNLFMLSARKGFVSMASVAGNSDRSQYAPLSTIMGGIKVVF